jgi:hypothetical protein
MRTRYERVFDAMKSSGALSKWARKAVARSVSE